jgi:hypothetical protein
LTYTCVVVTTIPPSAVLISTVLGWQSVQFSNEEESVDVAPPSQITGLISSAEVNSSPRKANLASTLIVREQVDCHGRIPKDANAHTCALKKTKCLFHALDPIVLDRRRKNLFRPLNISGLNSGSAMCTANISQSRHGPVGATPCFGRPCNPTKFSDSDRRGHRARDPVPGWNKYFNSSNLVAIPPADTRPLTLTRPHRLDQSVAKQLPATDSVYFLRTAQRNLPYINNNLPNWARHPRSHSILKLFQEGVPCTATHNLDFCR